MIDRRRIATEADLQAHELLADPEFLRVVRFLTVELCRRWRKTKEQARAIITSAIGEPKVISSIHQALRHARETGEHKGYPYIIARRRVLDLLERQRPRRLEVPIATIGGQQSIDLAFYARCELPESARESLFRHERQREVNRTLNDFARTAARHAHILRRRLLDELSYGELSAELGCTPGAARVRFHDAKSAFREYIERESPELRDLWFAIEDQS